MKYDIEKKQSHKGRWKYVWVAKTDGRFATVDEAVRAARKLNKKKGLPK